MSKEQLEEARKHGFQTPQEPMSFAFFLDKAKYPKPKKEEGDEEVEKSEGSPIETKCLKQQISF